MNFELKSPILIFYLKSLVLYSLILSYKFFLNVFLDYENNEQESYEIDYFAGLSYMNSFTYF